MSKLYRVIDLPSDEPVRYVGCYVLRWGKDVEPTVAFVPATQEDIEEAHASINSYDSREEATEGDDA